MAEFKIATADSSRNELWMKSKQIDTVYALSDATVANIPISYNIKKQTLNAGFGGSSPFSLPSQDKFVRNLILEFKCVLGAGDTAKVDYIAHNLLEKVEFQLGNTDRVRRNGTNIVMEQLLMCENEGKKDRLLELSGRKGALLNGSTYYFYCVLPVPFSSLRARDGKAKPFPIYLLDKENLVIDVTLAPRDKIFTDATAVSLTCNLIYETGRLKTVENYSLPEDGNPITYPFLHCFDQSINLGANVTAGQAGEINFTSIKRAEMTDIILQIRDAANEGVEIYDLELSLAGNVIWSGYNTSQDMFDLMYDDISHTHNKQIVRLASSAANVPYIGAPASANGRAYLYGSHSATDTHDNDNRAIRRGFNQHHFYVIPIADSIQKMPHDKLTGMDADKLSLKLTFKPVSNLTTANHRIDHTYRYQSAYSFDVNKGILQIY